MLYLLVDVIFFNDDYDKNHRELEAKRDLKEREH